MPDPARVEAVAMSRRAVRAALLVAAGACAVLGFVSSAGIVLLPLALILAVAALA